MIGNRRGQSLPEVIIVVVMVGVMGFISVGLSDMSKGSRYNDASAYAQAVGQSVASAVRAQPYKVYDPQHLDQYDLTGTDVQNLRGWPIQLTVENHNPTATPVWGATYPDSGFQRIRVSVTSPDGRTPAAVEFFKWAK